MYRKSTAYTIDCCGVTVVRCAKGRNDFRVLSSKSSVGLLRFSLKTFAVLFFWHSLLTLQKPFVYYAKIDKYRIYRDKPTGGIIISNILWTQIFEPLKLQN